MSYEYPSDSDGDALRRVATDGADMSRPMVIEFSVDAPDERTARLVAELVEPFGFEPHVIHNESTDSWSVYCGRAMLATYEGVVSMQSELNKLLGPHGAYCDGWGTFGNNQQ